MLVSPDAAHAKRGHAHVGRLRPDYLTAHDLGCTEPSHGKLRAQLLRVAGGRQPASGWHYHTCTAQLGFVLRGWVEMGFTDAPRLHLRAGMLVFHPGMRPHNELAMSDDCALLELTLPAQAEAIACKPDMRVVHTPGAMQRHVMDVRNAPLAGGRRDLGLAWASAGALGGAYMQGCDGMPRRAGEMLFVFVISGSAEFDSLAETRRLVEGAALIIPPGLEHTLRAGPDFRALEFSLPAAGRRRGF